MAGLMGFLTRWLEIVTGGRKKRALLTRWAPRRKPDFTLARGPRLFAPDGGDRQNKRS